MKNLECIAIELANAFKQAFGVQSLENIDLYVDESMFRRGRTGWFAFDDQNKAMAYDISERLGQEEAYAVRNFAKIVQ